MNIYKVRTHKGRSSQMRTIAYKGGEGGRGGSNFGDFCGYVLCG